MRESVVPDTRTLGQVLHEARIEYNPKTERPRGVAPWEERAPWQRDLDEQMAAEVEVEVRRRVIAEFRDYAEQKVPGGVARTACYEAIEFVMGARLL